MNTSYPEILRLGKPFKNIYLAGGGEQYRPEFNPKVYPRDMNNSRKPETLFGHLVKTIMGKYFWPIEKALR